MVASCASFAARPLTSGISQTMRRNQVRDFEVMLKYHLPAIGLAALCLLPRAVVGERSNVLRKCVLWLSASRAEGEFGCVHWLDTLIALRADGSRTSA